MEKQIRELRVDIDGLAQLTKGLKPFQWRSTEIKYEAGEEKPFTGFTSPIMRVEDKYSMGTGDGNNYRFQSIIKTDEGVFRVGCNHEANPHTKFTFDQNSKQINKSVDSLLLAKAWLGKALGELGTPSPYPNDGTRKSEKDIEPTAERADNPIVSMSDDLDFNSCNHIEKIDYLRQQIQSAINRIHVCAQSSDSITNSSLAYFLLYSEKHLNEARFYLGFELERIRELQPKHISEK